MKDFLMAHGVQASVVLFLVCYNVIGSALSGCLDKIEAYLAPDGKADPAANPGIEKIKTFISKTAGYASTIVDYLNGNREH